MALAVAFLALVPRLDGIYYPGHYLWAEDGKIFINQAKDLGISGLWTPHHGYLHVYIRLFAYIGSFFDLQYQPYFFFSGWLIAFGLLVAAIAVRAISLGVKPLHVCALVTLVALQPCEEQVMFNITNSHWMLGAALAIYLLKPATSDHKPPWYEYIILTTFCLCGPFSTFLAPFLIFNMYKNPNIKNNEWLYFIVLICASIQAVFMLTSDRLMHTKFNFEFGQWIEAYWQFLTFGANNSTELLASLIFWSSFLYTFIVSSKDNSTNISEGKRIALLLIGVAMVNIILSIYIGKAQNANPGWFLGPNRFKWIPYTLIFFSAIIVSNKFKRIRYLVLFSVTVICILHYESRVLPDLQFKSYAKFADYKKVVIPLNPQWQKFPSWHIKGQGGKPLSLTDKINLPTGNEEISTSGIAFAQTRDSKKFISNYQDPQIYFNKLISCPGASDIGVEINMNRDRDGWLQIFWNSDNDFSVKKESIRRYYPSGDIKAQFAFPNNVNGLYLRLDPFEKPGEAIINKLSIYCLR